MAGSTRRNTRIRSKSSHNGDEDDHDSKAKRKLRRDKSGALGSPGKKALFGFGLFALAVLSVFAYKYLNRPSDFDQKPRAVTPFPAPKLMDLPQFQGEHKESMYWGTYRPHVYLGIRARTPKSLIAGMMWIAVKDGQFFIRHVCQDSDGLSTYGWTHHNGRDYGRQLIVDNDLTLETSFIKSKDQDSGYGGDWAVRVDVQSENSSGNIGIWGNAHLFFYLGDEEGNVVHPSVDNINIHKNSLLAFGSRIDVGAWQLHVESPDNLQIHYAGFRTLHFHNISDLIQATLSDQVRRFNHLELPDSSMNTPNVLVFQIVGKIPLKADVAFLSGTKMKSSRVKERVKRLTGQSLTDRLVEKQNEFDGKFERCFNLTGRVDSEAMLVGKAAFGNLLGGIGYFYGQSKISVPGSNIKGHNYNLYWPAELYTAVPSRSYFPRGFLWDEGFHQLLVWRWDISICLDILGHWLDLMNIDGWIPREQILGSEALSKVPEEFVLQHPTNGNPPTLFLALHDLLSGLKSDKFNSKENTEISAFLQRASVRLDAWFKWFNTSQSGKDAGSYYWHGRDNITIRELNPKTLSSGLDDYPRASHPNDDERHLDLRCWMLLAANCMHSIGEILPDNKEILKKYGSTVKLLADFEVLNRMHFDEENGAYFDFGNHTEKVRLQWRVKMNGNDATKEFLREVLEKPKLQLVPQVGYVSLFPFMWKIIPANSWILEKQLDLISNKSILWTNFGIRSLAKTRCGFFTLYMKHNTEHDPPYWRGPIWINMNYMILSALSHYSTVDGPYKQKAEVIYNKLRSNLIRNIVDNHQSSGYLWEQYDQKTGKGKGTRPFTGWTSLLVLIMAEDYSNRWG
ncbi:hypothetical protein V2J09_015487 [Rumex salicifolius]